MAAEASPPRWGLGGLPETKRGGLGRRSTEGGSEEEPSVRRSSQAGAPVVGDGSVSRIWEEEVIGEGGLWGKTEPQPGRGHRVDGQYPQHPRRSALLGPMRRSLGWEVTRERALGGLRKAFQRSAGVRHRYSGAESP